MIKRAALMLLVVPLFASADLIEVKESAQWNVNGLAHYVRAKEAKNFTANLVSTRNNASVIGFNEPYDICPFEPKYKKVKVQYQWVNYVTHCYGGNEFWIPATQKGKDFVKQKFTSNSDVKVVFDNKTYTFSTKKFTSVRQKWERTVKTVGDAL
ncbi:hypothetical protein NM22_16875 [Vibrio tubiashii]|nr:hypothetical protein NM22_16875 [Vibrio tubiashii]